MRDKLGGIGYPYMYEVYDSMLQQGIWHGGWVYIVESGNVYITALYSIEQDNNNGIIGSQENPFSETAYSEMMLAETWQGGYVRHGDGPDSIIYHRSYDDQNAASGCGSGSDSGSGAGCGCGSSSLKAGSDRFRPSGFGVGWNVVVAWGDGICSGTSQPYVSAALEMVGTQQALALNASWDGCNRVKITGSVNMVGQNSGNIIDTYNFTIYYNVPDSYYN